MLRLRIAASLAFAALTAPAQSRDLPGLTVRSGETWIFRIEDGQPVGARKVDGNTNPLPGELLVSIRPEMGTIMFITNNTDKFYDYHAFLSLTLYDAEKPTTVCTVANAGRHAIENWPYPIVAIRISDFTETDQNHMVCR